MGVEARLVLYAASEPAAARAAARAFDRIAALEAVMSDYREDSELMALCRRAGAGPRPASDDLLDILSRAKSLAERTGGAFDPTIGPAVRLWRKARRDARLPDPDAIARARDLVDHTALRIDRDARTAELVRPGMRLDLGAIGKGYAADQAIDILAGEGITACLIDFGGDLTAADPPPGRDAWTIRIEHPGRDPRTLSLANAAVATSGDSEQFVEIDGVRYSHIVDPRTAVGLTNRAAATVIAPTGADADALASAACVLGPERAVALVEPIPDTDCLVTAATPDGPARAATSGFPAP